MSQRPTVTTTVTVTYKTTTPTAVFITYNETDTGRITTQDGLVLEYEVHRIGYNSGYESVTRKAQVVGYVGESTTVRIPATIDQYSITGVTFNEPLSIKEIYLDGMHADISSWKMPYLEDIWLLSNHSLWLFCAERYDEAGNVTRAALSCPTVHIPAKWSDNIWLYLCEDRDAPDRKEQTSNIAEKLLRNDTHSVQYMAEFYKQKYLENRGTEFVDQLMLKGQKGFVDYSVYTVAENGGFDYAYPTAGRYCCKVSYE